MSNEKVWFITGASRGLGLEITKAILAAGDKVVATARSTKDLSSIEKLGKPDHVSVALLDVTNKQQAKEAVDQAIEKFGHIDVLVNNAAYGLLGAVEESTDEEIRKMYEVNVFGLLNVTRAILPHMRKQRSGHIINISSGGGLVGGEGWSVYCSTKFAVEGLTESLAMELAPLGIHVTAIEPGYFRTNFLDSTSLVRSGIVIEDYSETVGKMRNLATQFNKNQPGDPAKLAQAIIRVANADQPPVHLPLGNDTLDMYKQKTAAFQQEIEEWYEVITKTNYDD
ncbi:oxidoreductase [Peribacillus loiseleuriae]|uniref:oxidoreductase n=1 Tax=Peribacillus loiseleuriae TaxID=1679170 RepID=UPI0037FF1349